MHYTLTILKPLKTGDNEISTRMMISTSPTATSEFLGEQPIISSAECAMRALKTHRAVPHPFMNVQGTHEGRYTVGTNAAQGRKITQFEGNLRSTAKKTPPHPKLQTWPTGLGSQFPKLPFHETNRVIINIIATPPSPKFEATLKRGGGHIFTGRFSGRERV